MITPENKKLLEDLAKTTFGKALEAYLDEQMDELDTVVGVQSLDEALGRAKAVAIINKLFYFMGTSNPQARRKRQTYT